MSRQWLAAVVMMLASSAAWADGARAVLTQLRGQPVVYELSNGEVRHVALVAPGKSFSLPLEVETGTDDAATFELTNSVIEVSANSMMRIVAPESAPTGVVQRVLQGAGSVLFHVHRGTIERFQVETPFLVSVVKGTVFNVLVRDDGATVSLQEGRLGVSSIDAQQTVDLLPGDVAFAGRDGVLRVLDVQLTNNDVKARTPSTSRAAGSEASRDVAAVANADADAPRTTTSTVAPAAETIVKNVAEPTVATAAPVVATVAPVVAAVAPVVSTVAPVVATVAPVVSTVIAPVVDNVVAPVVTPVVDAVAPVVATVVAPVVETVVAPVVETVVAPVIDAVVSPVVDVATPIVDTVAAPIVDAVIEPVIVPVVDGLADPVVTALDPLVPDVVTTTVDTIVTPIIDPIIPVLEPLLPDPPADSAPTGGLLGGLLGGLH